MLSKKSQSHRVYAVGLCNIFVTYDKMQPQFWHKLLNLEISGIRLWMKLLPLGDNSLPFGHSNSRSESSPLLQAPWPVGWVDWGSHPTGVESKGWRKSVGSALGLHEASRQRKSWLSRGLLREMGGNLSTSLLNFLYFLYIIIMIY